MGTGGAGLGVEPRPGIELPAPCIGHPLGKGLGSCPNEGTITLVALLEQDGHPVPALVSVCPEHVRPARHWLEQMSHPEDEVETYATRTLAEHFDVFERVGVTPWRLMRTA